MGSQDSGRGAGSHRSTTGAHTLIPPANDALAAVFRRESPAVLATLVRLSGDLDQAEDALQEALAVAAKNWPAQGVPANPGGWIMTTARRRLVDHHRRNAIGLTKERTAGNNATHDFEIAGEDRLTLLFTCCHPALNLESRVSLTLRTICGLTTEEIAAAFLVPTSTMAQRIVRAKTKIRVTRIPYEIPDPDQWSNRLSAVLATIYLTFNRGYDLGSDRRGVDLTTTGLELGQLLNLLVPREPEIEGLLALMLLTAARHRARLANDGTVILLEDQNRDLWDRRLVDDAHQLILRAPRHGSVGQYWLQAAIADEHITPAELSDRDWSAIVALYDKLLDQTSNSPVVRLNRALALAHSVDPAAALAEVELLGELLGDYSPFHASRGHLLNQIGESNAAANAYRQAITLAEPGPQRLSLVSVLNVVEQA